MLKNPSSLSIAQCIEELDGDGKHGLNLDGAQKRLEKYGPNQIPEQGPKNRWRILADQLLDPIIYILTSAALLAFVFGDVLEGIAILVVILISVGIAFFMELQAIRSLEALRKMGQANIRVVRSGKIIKIKASMVVPGDTVVIQTGDIIPADARLMEVENLAVKESALTGESIPITKQTAVLPHDTPITDQTNMVFRGTMAVAGSGKALVTSTGKHTQLGHIQQIGVEAEKKRTPLERKLNQLSKWLIWLTLFFALLIIVTGYIRGKDLLLMIETGVALAVAAIPEGLPIVATIALAQGMLRLSKKQVIIKKLEAVQTLGATNIICTDKTGTLTEDRMKAHTIIYARDSIKDVYHAEQGLLVLAKRNPVFEKMMMAAMLCNNEDPYSTEKLGDSIELALMGLARYLEYDLIAIRKNYPEILELPFDPELKLMASAHRHKERFHIFVKGAFESLVDHCDSILVEDGSKPFDKHVEWNNKVGALASQGLRTLAFAYKEVESMPNKETVLQHLTFLGIMGFVDSAREDVKATIDIYKKAGIKVVMVTGDHAGTAKKIAQEVGILDIVAPSKNVLYGKDIPNRDELKTFHSAKLRDASVFARVSPKQKLDLVTFFQNNNHIVGMIGDGINDVPALKKADIGIAMGIRGTEAAREVADVILKNDKFTAIELAIRQGRVVFQNIQQFVVYLLSCNLAEILSVGIAALLNLPAPLVPLQILFLNLVTDVFPALALGLGKGEEDSMEQPPRNPKEPILNRQKWHETIVYGLSISASVLGIVVYAYFVLELDSIVINNMAFYTLVLAQLLNVFNMPKSKESFLMNEVTKNPWVWSAIFLSLLITLGAYLISPVAKALSLETFSLELLGITILFAVGGLVLAQSVKRMVSFMGGK